MTRRWPSGPIAGAAPGYWPIVFSFAICASGVADASSRNSRAKRRDGTSCAGPCAVAIAAEHFRLDAPVRDEAGPRPAGCPPRGFRAPSEQLAGIGQVFDQYRQLMGKLEKNFPLAWAMLTGTSRISLRNCLATHSCWRCPGRVCRVPSLSGRHRASAGQAAWADGSHCDGGAGGILQTLPAAGAPLWQRPPAGTYGCWGVPVSVFAQQLGTRFRFLRSDSTNNGKNVDFIRGVNGGTGLCAHGPESG